MRFIQRAIAVALVAVGLAVAPAAMASATPPPGFITAEQDLSEPCGDTTGADVLVFIQAGAPNTQYGAEIFDVTAGRTVTDAYGNGVIRLDNVGIEDVKVHVSAANYNESRTLTVDIECGTGKGEDMRVFGEG